MQMPLGAVDVGQYFGSVCRGLCAARLASKNPSTNRQAYKKFLKFARSILMEVQGTWEKLTMEGVAAFSVAMQELRCECKASSLMVQRPYSCALLGGFSSIFNPPSRAQL